MIAVVLGSDEQVRAFALAGVEGHTCATTAETEREIAAIRARDDVALVLLAGKVRQLAPIAVRTLQRGEDPPYVLVLPGEPG
jgi:vacuolar-type H+-ATPase subunit F/Vma7